MTTFEIIWFLGWLLGGTLIGGSVLAKFLEIRPHDFMAGLMVGVVGLFVALLPLLVRLSK